MRYAHAFLLFRFGAMDRRRWLAPLLAAMMTCCLSAYSLAADNAKPVDNAKPAEKAKPVDNAKPAEKVKPAEKKIEKGKKDLPAPEELILTTEDGLRLAVTYYRGTRGKETVPVVLLHMWKQSHSDYQDLALYLQSQGHAAIVPDLRGHGQSTHFKGAKKGEDLKAATLLPAQFASMVTEDMDAVKELLWERNNAGELNIDKLCVVGAEMGALIALDFAAFDAVGYRNGVVAYGPLRLGEFIKAVVLLSPEWSFHGLSLKQAMATPRVQRDISVLIVVGKKDNKAMAEAKRVAGIFERFHPEPTEDDRREKKTLFTVRIDTSLQGTQMLDPKLKVQETIGEFIDRRLVKSEDSLDWTWKERKRPHE